MQILNLMKTKKSVAALWHSIVSKDELNGEFDPYERVPVRQSEISEMLALHTRTDDALGYSKAERRDHENLSALRDILYPPSAA